MKKILLAQDKIILIDDIDWPKLIKYKWYAYKYGNTYYAIRRIGKATIYMHRQIMHAKPSQKIDHKNGNGLDNQRFNLRLATTRQNSWNQQLAKNSTSGFKGVCWSKAKRKWCVYICCNEKRYFLGYFGNKQKAIQVYNQAALKFFGSYANLNQFKAFTNETEEVIII